MNIFVQIAIAEFRMAYFVSLALINYGFTFLMFSITRRWLLCMAWLMLGVVLGRAKR